MSDLMTAARTAMANILSSSSGVSVAVTVKNSAGVEASINALSFDIGHTTDPNTGMTVIGRQANATFGLTALVDAGLGEPHSVVAAASRPWVVTWVDPQGATQKYKIIAIAVDRTLDIATCQMETIV